MLLELQCAIYLNFIGALNIVYSPVIFSAKYWLALFKAKMGNVNILVSCSLCLTTHFGKPHFREGDSGLQSTFSSPFYFSLFFFYINTSSGTIWLIVSSVYVQKSLVSSIVWVSFFDVKYNVIPKFIKLKYRIYGCSWHTIFPIFHPLILSWHWGRYI